MNREKILLKITEKWPVKILSVAAALVITIFYRMNSLETRFITVPLFVETNETLTPASLFAETVRVTIRGEASSINLILEEDIDAYIDLSKYKNQGSFRIPVQIRKNGNALKVDPLEISVTPMEVRIILEQKEIRNIPIFPDFTGTIAQGFEMINESIIPADIAAEGPRSSLDNLYEFTTEVVDLEKRYSNFTVLVNVINNNPLIKIHGNQMIEYSASIQPILREFNYPYPEHNYYPEIPENGDEQE